MCYLNTVKKKQENTFHSHPKNYMWHYPDQGLLCLDLIQWWQYMSIWFLHINPVHLLVRFTRTINQPPLSPQLYFVVTADGCSCSVTCITGTSSSSSWEIWCNVVYCLAKEICLWMFGNSKATLNNSYKTDISSPWFWFAEACSKLIWNTLNQGRPNHGAGPSAR